MTSDLDNNKAPKPKAKPKKKSVSAAELKRQIADLKANLKQQEEENDLLSELVETQQAAIDGVANREIMPGEQIADISVLSDRWTRVLGEIPDGDPIYFLDGDTAEEAAGFIAKIPQDEDECLYQVKVGKKVAYMGDIEDAGEQGEVWADVMAGEVSRRARNNPVQISQHRESNDYNIGQTAAREMSSVGDAREAMSRPNSVYHDEPTVSVIGSMAKAEALAFNEQELQVTVHDTNSKQDIPIPCFVNDGRPQYFIRGKTQTVKRKYVEILARCKMTTFGNELYQDAVGADAYRYPGHTALMYPFSVVYDPDPRGGDWLRAILAEEQ